MDILITLNRVIIYIRGTELIVPRFRPRLLDVYISHGSAKTGLVTQVYVSDLLALRLLVNAACSYQTCI